MFDIENSDINSPVDELNGQSIASCLLTPTKIYVKPILELIEQINVKGISHITGGGFYENIPRSIPDGLCGEIEQDKINILPIFKLISKIGNIDVRDMFNTFNMGVGMTIIVDKDDVNKSLEILKNNGENAYVIGQIIKGEQKVKLI